MFSEISWSWPFTVFTTTISFLLPYELLMKTKRVSSKNYFPSR